jgi:hypothetical protein
MLETIKDSQGGQFPSLVLNERPPEERVLASRLTFSKYGAEYTECERALLISNCNKPIEPKGKQMMYVLSFIVKYAKK